MSTFEWLAAVIVVLSLVYVSFVLTLWEWFILLRKGQAVTLLPERHGRKWPLWTQVGMILLGLVICIPFFYYLWIPLLAFSPSAKLVLEILGFVIYLAGLSVVLWARRTLGRNWGITSSLQVKLKEDHQLIQAGPYAFVRHPMYCGWWLAMIGLVLLYPVWAMLLMLFFSVISFFNRARLEETALSERFGQAWAEYKKRTRFIIPFLY